MLSKSFLFIPVASATETVAAATLPGVTCPGQQVRPAPNPLRSSVNVTPPAAITLPTGQPPRRLTAPRTVSANWLCGAMAWAGLVVNFKKVPLLT
jgi:hypothetical protein